MNHRNRNGDDRDRDDYRDRMWQRGPDDRGREVADEYRGCNRGGQADARGQADRCRAGAGGYCAAGRRQWK